MEKALPLVDVDCNMCHAVCVDLGGTVTLQTCGACLCVSYCSKDCQVKDWKRHKSLCKKVRQMNDESKKPNESSQIVSISEAVKGGVIVYFDQNDNIVGARQTTRKVCRALENANVACTFPILLSTSGSDAAPIACNCLFSAAVATSTVTARLASSLGLAFSDDTKIPLATVAVTAQMQCIRSGYEGGLKVPVITQVAFAIEQEPRYEVVLGKDW